VVVKETAKGKGEAAVQGLTVAWELMHALQMRSCRLLHVVYATGKCCDVARMSPSAVAAVIPQEDFGVDVKLGFPRLQSW